MSDNSKKVSITEKIYKRAEEFKEKDSKELKKLAMDDLVLYYKQKRAYDLVNDKLFQEREKRAKEALCILKAMKLYHALRLFNIKVEGNLPETDRPVIYAVSHIGYYDVEIVTQVINKPFYYLGADEEEVHRKFDGFILEHFGINYVVPEDKIDTTVAFRSIVQNLKNGIDEYWNPEGTHNLTCETLILPLRYKIIVASILANALIVPIGINQIDKKIGKDFKVIIGEAYDAKKEYSKLPDMPVKEKLINLVDELRSLMARVKYDCYPTCSRKDIDDDYYDKFLEERRKECPYYTPDLIKRRTFKPEHYTLESEVFEHLNSIQIDEHNAFLARVRYQYNKENEKRVFYK